MSRLHTELLYPAASLVVALAGAVADLRDRLAAAEAAAFPSVTDAGKTLVVVHSLVQPAEAAAQLAIRLGWRKAHA